MSVSKVSPLGTTKDRSWRLVAGGSLDSPALKSVHELPRGLEAFAHERRLLSHGDERIFEEASLVLDGSWRRHV